MTRTNLRRNFLQNKIEENGELYAKQKSFVPLFLERSKRDIMKT